MKEKRSMANAPDGDQLLVTVDEAARRLSIGRSHLYEYLLRGSLRSVRIGRSRRIVSRDLEAFIEGLLQDSTDAAPTFAEPAQIRAVKRVPKPPRRR
jgi:excisionase family DNA binding protein